MMNILAAGERLGFGSRLRQVLARRAATSLGGVLALAFLPKCPLCIAAYLTAFGMSASIAAILAPYLRPSAALLVVAALLGCTFGLWRARQCRPAPDALGGAPRRRAPNRAHSALTGRGRPTC
jgi:hypothetical protein